MNDTSPLSGVVSPAECIMDELEGRYLVTLVCHCSPRGHRVEGRTYSTDALDVARTQAQLHEVLLTECRRIRAEAFPAQEPKPIAWSCASCGSVGPEGPALPPRFRFSYVRTRGGGYSRKVLCSSPRCAKAFGGYAASTCDDGGPRES